MARGEPYDGITHPPVKLTTTGAAMTTGNVLIRGNLQQGPNNGYWGDNTVWWPNSSWYVTQPPTVCCGEIHVFPCPHCEKCKCGQATVKRRKAT